MPLTQNMINIVAKSASLSKMEYKMGCGIFRGKKLLSSGYNLKLSECSRHAEMSAIENLMRKLGLLNRFRTLLKLGHRGL